LQDEAEYIDFLIDLLTLPIRIVTCIPRAIYNATAKEHRLLSYLKQNGVPKELIETDHVCVELKGDFGKNSQFKEKNFADEEHTVLSQSGGLTVHFVAYPLYPPRGSWWSRTS